MVKIGIVSDTHDKRALVDQSIRIFEEEKCDYVIHCGDFTSEDIFNRFKNKSFRFLFVTDRTSHDKELSEQTGFLSEEIGNLRIAAKHGIDYNVKGHKVRDINKEITPAENDYFFYGHFHYFNLRWDSRDNKTVYLNPGSFYEKNLYTFCILDTVDKTIDTYYYFSNNFHKIFRCYLNWTIIAFFDKAIFNRFKDEIILKYEPKYKFSEDDPYSWLNQYPGHLSKAEPFSEEDDKKYKAGGCTII